MDRTNFIIGYDGQLDLFSNGKILITEQNMQSPNLLIIIYQLYSHCLLGYLTTGRLQKKSTFNDSVLNLPIPLGYGKMVYIMSLLPLLSLRIRSKVLFILRFLSIKYNFVPRWVRSQQQDCDVRCEKIKRKNSCLLAA
ncbi:MAG: hypothetical protein WCP85_24255 [Mariniphaga sp.]